VAEATEQELTLARVIAQADFIWQMGEDGVMACNPKLAGDAFDEAWKDATSSTRLKFVHLAQCVLAHQKLAEWAAMSRQPTPELEVRSFDELSSELRSALDRHDELTGTNVQDRRADRLEKALANLVGILRRGRADFLNDKMVYAAIEIAEQALET